MGGSVKTVESGVGAAIPLANEFVNVLQNFLRSGKFGVGADNAVGRSMGAFDTINQLVSGTDVSGMGKSIESIIQGDVTRGAADLRERFTGGTAAGTPAAVSESLYRAEAAPRAGLAIGQLDLQNKGQQAAFLSTIMNLIAAMSGKGISQAQTNAFWDPGMATNIAALLAGGGQAVSSIVSAGKAGGG